MKSSDVFATLFEKIILSRLESSDKSIPETQFGFRKNSSCSRATFVLKELMKITVRRKKFYYVVVFDA